MPPHESPILGLPYVQPAQAQKHVTVNTALRRLDAAVQLSVPSLGTAQPPAVLVEGERHLVAPGATGEWAGRDGAVAIWQDGYWSFAEPRIGWLAYLRAGDGLAVYTGTGWVEILKRFGEIGINTDPDPAAPLAVSGDVSRLSHAGSDHRLVINKAATADTGSLLFQSGWSGRAEMGLAGEDAFSVKVSAEGAAWRTAITVNPSSGQVSFPSGLAQKGVPGSVYVDPGQGDDGGEGLAPGRGAFASLERAIAAVRAIVPGGGAPVIVLADGDHVLPASLTLDQGGPGTADLRIVGNTGTPGAVRLVTSGQGITVRDGASLVLSGCALTGPADVLLRGETNARIALSDIVLGAADEAQIRLENAEARITGTIVIEAGAAWHARLLLGARLAVGAVNYDLTSGPSFGHAFLGVGEGSVAALRGAVFSGAAIGRRFDVTENGTIATNGKGATYLPGNRAGTAASGGVYS